MNVIFGVALAALIIGSVLIQFWPVIEALSGGAAAFLGALVGAAAGLGAILVGALYNAKLNRRRDDRLRDEETRAIAAALRAEMHALEQFVTRGLRSINEWHESAHPISVAELTNFDIAEQTIFESLANKLGLLGTELALAIVTPHAVIGRIRTNMEALKNQGLQVQVSDDVQIIFIADYENIEKTSREAIQALDNFIDHRP